MNTARRVWRRSVLALAALVLFAYGFQVLPSANAMTLPIRVAGSHPKLDPSGPKPSSYPFKAGLGPFTLDTFGFVVGQCTSFVAWWLNAHGVPMAVLTVGPHGTGSFLNASTWDAGAARAGFSQGSVPVVGAVAQWHAGERSLQRTADGSDVQVAAARTGHVAVVVAVLPDGEAQWVEYAWRGRATLHAGHGWAPRYLYLGVSPPRTAAR